MNVLIYQDYIHNNGALHRALCRTFGADQVGFCDATDIIAGALKSGEAQLFVIPGGADLYYAEKLNGAGNRAIRKWVEDGGCYLGICAGAYYACAAIDWASGQGGDAIAAPRELAFFPGTAVGPVYDFIQDKNFRASWHGTADIIYDDGNGPRLDGKAFYEAGPVFIPNGEDKSVIVLARYSALSGQPAAIVSCSVGKGSAILCGPHPEQDSDSLRRRLYRHANPSYEWNGNVADSAIDIQLWERLMAHCLPAQYRRAA